MLGVVAVLALAGSAHAKGREPEVVTKKLVAPQAFERVTLPKGTTVRLERGWDGEHGQYGPQQLARFTLPASLDACGARLPAHVEIEIRRGPPAFAWTEVGASSAVHVVWHTRAAMRAAARTIPAGSLVGFECGADQLSLLVEPGAFEVGTVKATSAAWYPSDVARGLLWIQLAARADLGAVHVPADSLVTFDPSGRVVRIFSPRDAAVIVGDRVCLGGGAQGIVLDAHGRASCDP